MFNRAKGALILVCLFTLSLLAVHSLQAQFPDGSRIVYIAYEGSDSEVWSITPQGGDARLLAENRYLITSAACSPDGSFIATNDNDIFLHDLQTGEVDDFGLPLRTHYWAIKWSQTGSRVAFAVDEPRMGMKIYMANSDGSTIQEVVSQGSPYFSWSRDDSQLVYHSSRDDAGDVYVVNVDGTNERRLTQGAGNIGSSDPGWSPTADEIVFTSNRAGGSNIYVFNADGTNLRQLTFQGQFPGQIANHTPIWSPDGSQIVFTSMRSEPGATGLYIMNADGSNVHRLITNAPSQESAQCWIAEPKSALTASITFPGRPAAPNARLSQAFTVKFSQPAMTAVSFTPTTNDSGTFALPAIPYGAYALWLKHAQHLAASVPVTVSAPTSSVTVPTLRAGDASNDNRVNITDFSIVSATYGKSSGTAGYDARADFNGDNTVNISDYSLLTASFGQIGAPDPSPPDGTFSATLPPPSELANAAITLEGAPRGGARIGRTFTLTVRAGNNAASGIVASQIDSADLHLRFDPARLQVVAVTPGTALDRVIVSTFDNVNGTIDVAAGKLGGVVDGRFTAFTVELRAIASGTTTIDADAPTALAYQGATASPAVGAASVTVR